VKTAQSSWHLVVDDVGRPGFLNMALDRALLEDADRSGTATLRLYCWTPPCLSFGRHEPASRRYDRARVEQLGLHVVRRPTGGRAVWHEHEVTYAVAAPVDAFGSLRAAYRTIHERLAAALRALGADATLAPDRGRTRPPRHSTAASPDRPGPCFGAAVGGEILVGGRKLVGSAQVRHGDAFLQHGSILLGGSQESIQAVSRQPSATGGATTLAAVLGRPVTFHQVVDAIIRTWGQGLAATASYRPLPPLTGAFLDPAWTWRR